jgi:hypothetical protein
MKKRNIKGTICMTASMSGSIANKGEPLVIFSNETDSQVSHVLRTIHPRQHYCKCAEVQLLNGEHTVSESTYVMTISDLTELMSRPFRLVTSVQP